MRMASDSPSWGYCRIQGALKHIGHPVARSTIAEGDHATSPSDEIVERERLGGVLRYYYRAAA